VELKRGTLPDEKTGLHSFCLALFTCELPNGRGTSAANHAASKARNSLGHRKICAELRVLEYQRPFQGKKRRLRVGSTGSARTPSARFEWTADEGNLFFTNENGAHEKGSCEREKRRVANRQRSRSEHPGLSTSLAGLNPGRGGGELGQGLKATSITIGERMARRTGGSSYCTRSVSVVR